MEFSDEYLRNLSKNELIELIKSIYPEAINLRRFNKDQLIEFYHKIQENVIPESISPKRSFRSTRGRKPKPKLSELYYNLIYNLYYNPNGNYFDKLINNKLLFIKILDNYDVVNSMLKDNPKLFDELINSAELFLRLLDLPIFLNYLIMREASYEIDISLLLNKIKDLYPLLLSISGYNRLINVILESTDSIDKTLKNLTALSKLLLEVNDAVKIKLEENPDIFRHIINNPTIYQKLILEKELVNNIFSNNIVMDKIKISPDILDEIAGNVERVKELMKNIKEFNNIFLTKNPDEIILYIRSPAVTKGYKLSDILTKYIKSNSLLDLTPDIIDAICKDHPELCKDDKLFRPLVKELLAVPINVRLEVGNLKNYGVEASNWLDATKELLVKLKKK